MTSNNRSSMQVEPEDPRDKDLEVLPPLVLVKPTQVDSETEDDSGLVKVITVQANLQLTSIQG